jgi:hypothetical protein
MRSCFAIAALASFVSALPQIPQNSDPPKAGSGIAGLGAAGGRTGKDYNELLEGSCKDVFLIYARATLEPGNLVSGAYLQYLNSLVDEPGGNDLRTYHL